MTQFAALNVERSSSNLNRTRRDLARWHKQKLSLWIHKLSDEPRARHPVHLHLFPRNPFHNFISSIADTTSQSTPFFGISRPPNRRRVPSRPSSTPPCLQLRTASPASRMCNHLHGARIPRPPCRTATLLDASKPQSQKQTSPSDQ